MNRNGPPLVTQTLPVAARIPMRIDRYLVQAGITLSRTRIQRLIQEGRVLLNGSAIKPSQTVQSGDRIEIDLPKPTPLEIVPEAIPLDVVYEDSALLVLNKPAGIVVHPAAGNWQGTLVHALLHHCRDLAGIGGRERPGIVHRLDKETSGILVVAKTDLAHQKLSAQFKNHTIARRYVALVRGNVAQAGKVILPIGRDTIDRKKISARTLSPREAETHYTVRERLKVATLVDLYPQTGRTHQLRVHMSHLGHPVVGDRTYGGRPAREIPVEAGRQMLHAEQLGFLHPTTGAALTFSAPLPDDMAEIVSLLRADRADGVSQRHKLTEASDRLPAKH